MAFVFESERNINQASKNATLVGPADYDTSSNNRNVRASCAPFQSTNRRKTLLNVEQQSAPGPGNYDISKPIIEPNIKTVSNSQNIIIKINSLGTSQFKSIVTRFKDQNSDAPGPGQYQPMNVEGDRRKIYSLGKERLDKSERQSALAKKLRSLEVRKNYPAIPEKIRGLTDKIKQEVDNSQQLGPGSYNPKQTLSQNNRGTVWGKDKIKRFSLDSKNEIGPGKYNPFFTPIKPDEKLSQPSFQYKSTTVRSFFDALIYQSSQKQTVKVRENARFKTTDPAPGQYETISSIKIQERPYALQFFGSTVERFSDEKVSTPNIKKKTFYNLKSQIGKDKSFNKSSHAFLSETVRKPEFLNVEEREKFPGPGHYRESKKIVKKLRGVNIEKFGSKTKRSFQIENEKDEIGPGKYYSNSTSLESPRNNRFGQISEKNSNFKSTTVRDCFGINRCEKNPFAEYDLSHNDLSKRVEKQKMFIENLKRIDVDKPAFESSKPRFPHYDNSQAQEHKFGEEKQRIEGLKILEQSQKKRQVILKANQQQVSENKINHFGKSVRFVGDKKKSPPVGQYNLRKNWEKRSFNVKFSK